MAAARIATKYQLTLPKEVRKDLKISPGDLIVFEKGKGAWKIHAIPNDPIRALREAGKNLTPSDFRRLHEEHESGWDDSERNG